MGQFAKVPGARVNAPRSPYFEHGGAKGHGWVVLVNRVKKGADDKPAFIVEAVVLETDCPTAPVGAERTQYVNMSFKPSAGDVAQFVTTVMSCESNEIDEASMEEMVSDRQPLSLIQNGHAPILRLRTWDTRANKPEKEPFTGHFWSQLAPADLQKYEEFARKMGRIQKAA